MVPSQFANGPVCGLRSSAKLATVQCGQVLSMFPGKMTSLLAASRAFVWRSAGRRSVLLRGMLLSLSLAAVAVAYQPPEEVFHYKVREDTKTDHLDVTRIVEIVIQHWGDPRPVPHWEVKYSISYEVHGCTEKTFSFSEEGGSTGIDDKHLKGLLADVHAIPFEKLTAADDPPAPAPAKPAAATEKPKEPTQPAPAEEWTKGMLNLEGTPHEIDSRSSAPETAHLRRLITALIDENILSYMRRPMTWQIVSDLTTAYPVTLQKLFKNPLSFEGSRVRLTGYYSVADGILQLSASPAEVADRLLVGELSTFAHADDGRIQPGRYVIMDGTFRYRSHDTIGNVYSRAPTLERITRIVEKD